MRGLAGAEGELDAAAELVALLEPFADRIPFAPHPTDRPAAGTGSAHVRTTGEAARLLAQRRPNAAVAAQHEALTVWRPFEDELLAYWLRQADTSSASSGPAPADLARTQGAALLERYEALTAAHPLTGRHRDPKSNTAVLLRALSESAAGRELPPHLTGLLRSCVASMVARRGRPGSPEHTRLRLAQARQAAQPAHSELAALVRDRLALLDPDSGLADPDAVLGPVTVEEAGQTGLTSGTAVPPAVRAVVTAALSAPPETLLACGVVTSAEPLAELAPQYLGADLALAWHPEVLDGPLRTLLTELYQGSRRFNPYLRRFARYPDLPWIRAVSPTHVREPAHAALRRLAFLALEAFPGSDPSSRLIQQLVELAQEAGIQASFFLEPFADNYTRTVTGKLMPAARVAADLLRGTPYERYYGIDYAAVRDMAEADDREGFGRLCVERAGPPGPGRPQALKPTFMPLVSDPVVIEQAMTLTTFNLAPLVHEVGVTPRAGWDALARGAFTAARSAVGHAEEGGPRVAAPDVPPVAVRHGPAGGRTRLDRRRVRPPPGEHRRPARADGGGGPAGYKRLGQRVGGELDDLAGPAAERRARGIGLDHVRGGVVGGECLLRGPPLDEDEPVGVTAHLVHVVTQAPLFGPHDRREPLESGDLFPAPARKGADQDDELYGLRHATEAIRRPGPARPRGWGPTGPQHLRGPPPPGTGRAAERRWTPSPSGGSPPADGAGGGPPRSGPPAGRR